MPQDAELVRLAREGIEQLNQKYENHRPDIFYLLPPPAPLERPGRGLDGLRTQARQAGGVQCALTSTLTPDVPHMSARARRSPKSSATRPCCRKCATSSRSTRTRNCRAIRPGKWSGRWPTRSIGRVRSRAPPGRRRLRHPAAARRREPAAALSRSWFVRLFAGDAGVDPYTRVVSDLYQDLFGEGSFVGKGIYDVDAFEQCCGNFPENAILSHDLLESTHARSALLSDVELYEEYPVALPDRRQPTASLDARRLADRLVAAAVGAGACRRAGSRTRSPRCRGGRSSTTSAGAWCRWRCCSCCCSPGCCLDPLLAAGVTLFVLAVVGAVPLLAVLRDLIRKPADLPLTDAPARDGQRPGQTAGAVPVHARLPPLRGVHQRSMRSCAR